METKTVDPPKKDNEKAPITKPSVLDDVLADLKKDHRGIDLSFMSVEDQIRAYREIERVNKLAEKEAKKEEAKKDIQTPLNSPPPSDTKPKTFLQRQKEVGYEQNLFNAGGLLAKIDKLYK